MRNQKIKWHQSLACFLFTMVTFVLSADCFAQNCDSTTAGATQYDSTNKVMMVCNGSAWNSIGGGLNTGSGCRWVAWNAKGAVGGGNSALYSNPGNVGTLTSANSGGYCNLNEYAAGVSGSGISTGGKIDAGYVLCCPLGGVSNVNTATSTNTGTGGGRAGGFGGGAGNYQ
jgi:hypothetical protein